MTAWQSKYWVSLAAMTVAMYPLVSDAASNHQSVVALLDAAVQAKGASGFSVEVSDLPATHVVSVGSPLELKIQSQAPSFVSMLYVDSHGVLDVYRPALSAAGNFIDAGAVIYFAGANGQELKARPPIGQAALYVFASAEPLAQIQPPNGPSEHFLIASSDAEVFAKRLIREIQSRKAGSIALRKFDLSVELKEGADYSASDIVQYFTQTTRSIDKPRLDIYINFAFNSADILPESAKALATWGRVLSDPLMSGQSFTIGGHTDDVGSAEFNMELSKRRAQAVRSLLVSRYGIAESRLRIEGFGMNRPMMDGVDNLSRAKNRRVDFERLSKVP